MFFVGAGPGAADLISVRGLRLIERCPVCLYAGSLVPPELVAAAPPGALVRDTSGMHLEEIIDALQAADAAGQDVARVHSGDPSLYSAVAEQMRRLDALQIGYEVVPGVPAFAAAAARLRTELTLPGVSQTVVLTRVSGGPSPMPEREALAAIGGTGATLALHLSARHAAEIAAALIPHYGPDCPAVIVFRAEWPDERILATTLEGLEQGIAGAGIERSAIIFVGRVFAAANFRDSRLYEKGFSHYRREGE